MRCTAAENRLRWPPVAVIASSGFNLLRGPFAIPRRDLAQRDGPGAASETRHRFLSGEDYDSHGSIWYIAEICQTKACDVGLGVAQITRLFRTGVGGISRNDGYGTAAYGCKTDLLWPSISVRFLGCWLNSPAATRLQAMVSFAGCPLATADYFVSLVAS
jgi:hypothetical protein